MAHGHNNGVGVILAKSRDRMKRIHEKDLYKRGKMSDVAHNGSYSC